MGKTAKHLAGALLTVAVILVGSCSLQSHNRTKTLDQISAGDTEKRVVELLGEPAVREFADHPYLRYATQGCMSPCVTRLWWEWPVFPGIEAWSVELDSSQRVIQTEHWVSP
jgi:hypothetical protein